MQHRARQGYLSRWQSRDLSRPLLAADRSIRVVRQLLHGTEPLRAAGQGPPGAHVVESGALSRRHRQTPRVRPTNATRYPAPMRHHGGCGNRVWFQQPAAHFPGDKYGRTAASGEQSQRHHPTRMGLCRLGRSATSYPRASSGSLSLCPPNK